MQPTVEVNPAEYLKEALDIIQNNAYFADRVKDWDVLRQQAKIMAKDAQNPAGTYAAINMVLEHIGHRHTFFIPAGKHLRNPEHDNVTIGLSVVRDERQIVQILPGSSAAHADLQVGDTIIAVDDMMLKPDEVLPDFDHLQRTIKLALRRPGTNEIIYALLTPRMMVRDVLPEGRDFNSFGYLELPGVYDPPNYNMYIRVAHDLMHNISMNHKINGWIVDLRRNKGGSVWPMLVAIGVLLGEGEVGKFVYRDGREEVWYYATGTATLNDKEMASALIEDIPDYRDAPVALLLSPLTASAGELLTIAFSGRKKTRTFGEPTSGIPTANTNFELADGAHLVLTTAACADRNGRLYLESLAPDEVLESDWSNFSSDSDPLIQAALKWLRSDAGDM